MKTLQSLLTPGEWQAALGVAERAGVSVERILNDEFAIPLHRIRQAKSSASGLPEWAYVAEGLAHDLAARSDLSFSALREHGWLPVSDQADQVMIVISDPQVRHHSSMAPSLVFPKRLIEWRITTEMEFERYAAWLCDRLPVVEEPLILPNEEEDEPEDAELDDQTASNEIVRRVNAILADANRQRASDIHIEPVVRDTRRTSRLGIRFRIDGELAPQDDLPFSIRQAIVSRIKVMAGLDTSERRRPQSGKFRLSLEGVQRDFRVETLPSAGGMEDVVIRLLPHGKPIPLLSAGFTTANLEKLREAITAPHGLFIVCGPTGSGKTTTLHTLLDYLNRSEVKILTAEDPVEMMQEGLRQVQINRKAGLDFASLLRSFMRADPDVIMVGEMRDRETAAAALEASLTGHMVFSTLHTNSAPESIPRLLDMGMDAFNFADALTGILAQRLVRRLCPHCKEAYEPTPAEINRLAAHYAGDIFNNRVTNWAHEQVTPTLYRAAPRGCEQCGGRGRAGRYPLHELLIATNEVKEAVRRHAHPRQIAEAATTFKTLRQDGIEKILLGEVCWEDVVAHCH